MKQLIVIASLLVVASAFAQPGTPPLLLLGADGHRLARYNPEGNDDFRDSVLAGLAHLSAIAFNPADTLIYVIDSGDSNGVGCRILRFGPAVVFKNPIPNVDTFAFADDATPTDIVFYSATKAFVTLSGTGNIAVVDPSKMKIDTLLALPGKPAGLLRMSLSKTLVICSGATSGDSSYVVLMDSDSDSIITTRKIPGHAERGVVDRNFRAHVLSRLGDTMALVTAFNLDLSIDTSYRIAGDFSMISITSAIDTNKERVLLSNGAADSMVGQYNPLKRVVFQRGPFGVLALGMGSGVVFLENKVVAQYNILDSGQYFSTSRALTPLIKKYTAFLAVSTIGLNAVNESRNSTATPLLCTISPQPCSTIAEVTVSGAAHATLSVFDCLGRKLQTSARRENASWKIDVSALPAGLYCCVVGDGPVTTTRTLIVVR